MKNTSWVSAILSSVLLVGGMLPAYAQVKAMPAALVGDYAYVLGDARPVALGRGYVQTAEWTKYGNAATLIKTDIALTPETVTLALTGGAIPSLTQSAYLWNRKTNQAQLLEKVNLPNESIEYIETLPNERTCLVFTRTTKSGVSFADKLRIVNGATSEVIVAPSDGELGWVTSEKNSNVMVYVTSGKMASGAVSTAVRIFDADRGRWTPVSLGLESNQLIEYGIYADRMDAFMIRVVGFGGGKEGFIAYAPSSGNILNLTAEQFKEELRFNYQNREAVAPSGGLSVARHEVRYPDNTPYEVFSLGAETGSSELVPGGRPEPKPPAAKPDRRLYFAPGADWVELAPRADAVLVSRDGLVTVRDILRIDRDLMEKRTGPEPKEGIMSRAKQVGLGLFMYAGDNDDELPPPDGMKERIMPYLKDESIFDGFIYTYSGPLNLSNINDPANTELGFIRGVGGTAVLYADSSVRWKPDP